SAARFAIDLDRAAALLNDAVHRRQSEAGPVAGAFGGEERLEDVSRGLGVHAAAGIADRQLHPPPAIGLDIRQNDADLTAAGHRVARVDGEVHQDLFDRAVVGADEAERLLADADQLDVFPDHPPQDLFGARQDRVERYWMRQDPLAAAERQQLTREAARAVGRLPDFPHVPAPGPQCPRL